MSIRAMHWAMEQADLKSGPWRTLMFLADAANDEHNCAWLAIGTIARKSGTARGRVIEHIKELYRLGYIVPGDQRFVAHLAANKRPRVWQPNVDRGKPSDLRLTLPLDLAGGPETGPQAEVPKQDPKPSRGPENARSGVLNQDPNQELKPKHLTHLPAQGDGLARAREATPDGVAACRQALHHQETPA